jgi:hypothetical protein
MVARDLGLLHTADHDRIAGRIEEIRRMLNGLVKRIERDKDRQEIGNDEK